MNPFGVDHEVYKAFDPEQRRHFRSGAAAGAMGAAGVGAGAAAVKPVSSTVGTLHRMRKMASAADAAGPNSFRATAPYNSMLRSAVKSGAKGSKLAALSAVGIGGAAAITAHARTRGRTYRR